MRLKSILVVGVLALTGCCNATDSNQKKEELPVVYFTSEISPQALVKIYKKLNWNPGKKVAVKLSTGEPPLSNYLKPELIRDLVKVVDGTIVECNTAYDGLRSASAQHHKVAEDHGFTKIAKFDLLDEHGTTEIPVTNGKHLKGNIVGNHFKNYSDYLILSHFKGHAMAGFGGAIKNTSIGLGSSSGKCRIHTGGVSDTSFMGGEQTAFLESMGEAAKSVSDYLGKEHIVYVNVANRISIDCDCDGCPAEPEIKDIGILASSDPVALDQACLDLVDKAEGNASLLQRIKEKNGRHTLEYAEKIGYGSRKYKLVNIKPEV